MFLHNLEKELYEPWLGERRPEEIGTVVLTHSHPDRSGGCLTECGRPAFPNAYWMARQEFDYWTSNPGLDELPLGMGMRQVMLSSASRNICGIRNQPDLFGGEVKVHPGVIARENGAWRWDPLAVTLSHGA
jgi:glyoxylase-like metal-dependent hydrolase (beta-lactamase superfamily II)